MQDSTTDNQGCEDIVKLLITLINTETGDARQHIIEANSDVFLMSEIDGFYEKLQAAFEKSGNHEVCKKIDVCLSLIERYRNGRKKRFLIGNKLEDLPEPLRDALETMTVENRASAYQMISKQGKDHLTVYDILFIFHFSSRISSFHILNNYPELMSDQADKFLAKMMKDADQNGQTKIYEALDTDRTLLRRCKQIGIKEGYSEFLKGILNLDKLEIDEDIISLALSCQPQDLGKLKKLVDEGLPELQELSNFPDKYPELTSLIYKIFGLKPENFTSEMKIKNFDVLVRMLSKYM